jgi:hypothetical protein
MNVNGHALNRLTHVALLLVSLIVVTACGSGSVGPPPVNDPTKITILPAEPVVLYSGYPTTFSISGGTGAYIVSSSNQAIVPVSGNVSGGFLTVVPNPVVVETTLTLTARDTGTAAPVSVTLSVKPGTVSNTITITPSSADCTPAVCSGGDALVSTVISQGGIPIPARGVRYDVVSGDFLFITSPAGVPETLAMSGTTITDETGTARVRLRVSSTAANQTGILQVTDLGSGAFQRATLVIARASATQSAFFTIPTSVTFTGPNSQTCAFGSVATEIFVFGGSPPYMISNSVPDGLLTNTSVIAASGGSVRVTPTGPCLDNAAIGFTDAAGRTVTVSVSNKVGTAPVPTPPAFVVSPTAVTLTSCTSVASVVAVGGQSNGSYTALSNYSVVAASVNGGLISIRRRAGTDATGITGVQVSVTDGATIKTVDVTLSGAAAGNCP